MICIGWKPLERGAMLGFADIEMGNGMVLKDCILFESNGRKWINPPGKPALTADKKPMLDDSGKLIYSVVVDFTSKGIRSRWSDEAVAAVETFRKSTTPTEVGAMSGGPSAAAKPQGEAPW